MLSERVLQLLVAYVDGELPAHQREAVTRLVDESAEARAFVRQLESDAALLRRLPRRQLSADFSQKVMDTIGGSRPHGIPRARFGQAPVYPAWIGMAAAAAVIVVVGVGSALYFLALPARQDKLLVAKNDLPRLEKPSNQADAASGQKPIGPTPADIQQTPSPATNPQVVDKKDSTAIAEKQPVLEFTPDADIAVDASPTRRLEVFHELAEVKLALSLTLRDLDQPRLQGKLRDKLKEDTAFQLDVSCPANAKGLDRLEAAFQAKGVKLLIDKAAFTRWKKGLKTHYAFYTDDLTSDELSGILQALGADDKKAEVNVRFNRIIINHLTPDNQKELCSLLGVDPRSIQAKPKGPLGVDLTRPLSRKTGEQVADALAGKGTPRPEPGKPVGVAQPQTPDRFALVLSYNPVRAAPSSSKEIKQFLATRPGQRAGAVQVLLILRSS